MKIWSFLESLSVSLSLSLSLSVCEAEEAVQGKKNEKNKIERIVQTCSTNK